MNIAGLFNFFFRPKLKAHVLISDSEIVSIRSNGLKESVRIDDLTEVVIITTDEGPFSEDVFFALIGKNEKSGCAVPQSADGTDKLLAYLQGLPGFDNEAVIKAMGSTSNAKFVCWKKPAVA